MRGENGRRNPGSLSPGNFLLSNTPFRTVTLFLIPDFLTGKLNGDLRRSLPVL